MKTAAVAALVAAAGLGASMTAADAHGKKHFGIGFGSPSFYNYGYGTRTIVLGSPGYSCEVLAEEIQVDRQPVLPQSLLRLPLLSVVFNFSRSEAGQV